MGLRCCPAPLLFLAPSWHLKSCGRSSRQARQIPLEDRPQSQDAEELPRPPGSLRCWRAKEDQVTGWWCHKHHDPAERPLPVLIRCPLLHRYCRGEAKSHEAETKSCEAEAKDKACRCEYGPVGCQCYAQAADSQHGSSLRCSLLSRPSRHQQQRSPGAMEQRPLGPLPKGGQRPAQLWLPTTREGTMVTALWVLWQRAPERPQRARLRGRCLGKLRKLPRRRRGLKARQGNPRQPEVLARGRLRRRRHPLPCGQGGALGVPGLWQCSTVPL